MFSLAPAVKTASPNVRIQQLPLQGRSFTGLLTLTPGVVTAPNYHERFRQWPTSQLESNYIDGVNANFGSATGGESPAVSASGNMPALTASGGGNGIATFDAISEFNIQSSAAQPEQGRVAGAQVEHRHEKWNERVSRFPLPLLRQRRARCERLVCQQSCSKTTGEEIELFRRHVWRTNQKGPNILLCFVRRNASATTDGRHH